MSVNPIHQETIIGEVSIIQEQYQEEEIQDKQQIETEDRKETDFGKYHRIMKQLEEEGEKVAKNFITGKTEDISTLTSFMSDGSNRFKESVGRPMTYGEMREMWG